MPGLFQIYKQAYSGLRRDIWILSLAMFINRSGSMVLLFTSLYLTRDLHFSIAEAGIIMSFYGVGSVLGSYAGGWLTDRRSNLEIMIGSLLTSGCILLTLLLATSMVALATIIFLYAFTADMFRPANSKAIATYSDDSNRARSVALMRMAINLGFTVGPAMGGIIAVHLGYSWLFVIDAFTSFGAAVMIYYYLPRQKFVISHHQQSILNDSRTSAYRDYRYLAFIVLVALYGTSFFQIFASAPQYFNKVAHYSEDTIGLLMALNGMLVVLIEMPIVHLLEKNKRIFRFIITGVMCLPVSFAFLLFGEGSLLMAMAYTIIITFSEIFAMPFMMNYTLSRPMKERQGQYSALYSISYGLANIAAPAIGLGIAARYGFNNMFVFFIFLSLITAAGFGLLSYSEKTKMNLLTNAHGGNT